MALRTGDLLMSLFKRSGDWIDLQGDNLNHLKREMQTVMDDVVEVCEKHHLTYILAYGSALGAIRHKGYIPWDDDIDLCMPRADYDRFLEVAEREMGDRYYILSVSKGDNIAVPTCHIKRKGTRYVNYSDMVVMKNLPEDMKGIYIDIFPLENASDIAWVRKIDGYLNLFLQFIIASIVVRDCLNTLEKMGVQLSKEEKAAFRLKRIIAGCFCFWSAEKWYKVFDRFARKNKNNNSKYVTSLTGYKNLRKSTYLREKVCQTMKSEFEGRQYSVPADYDYYLKTIYSDYMKMPDVNHRKVHPVFEIQFSDGTKL